MKIHPNEFTLEEFLLSLSRQHLEVVEHLVGCATCRGRFQGLVRQRSLSKQTADVLQWSRQPAEYGPALSRTTPQKRVRMARADNGVSAHGRRWQTPRMKYTNSSFQKARQGRTTGCCKA